MNADIFFSVAVSRGAGMLLFNRSDPLEKVRRSSERISFLSLAASPLGIDSR
jgi:hypothetical protein